MFTVLPQSSRVVPALALGVYLRMTLRQRFGAEGTTWSMLIVAIRSHGVQIIASRSGVAIARLVAKSRDWSGWHVALRNNIIKHTCERCYCIQHTPIGD